MYAAAPFCPSLNYTIEGPEDLKANSDAKVCSATGTDPADNIEQYLASKVLARERATAPGVLAKCVASSGPPRGQHSYTT